MTIKNENVVYVIENNKPLTTLSSRLSNSENFHVKSILSPNEYCSIYCATMTSCLLIDTTTTALTPERILEVVKSTSAAVTSSPCVVYLAEKDINLAVACFKAGAFDVLFSPADNELAQRLTCALNYDATKRAKRIEGQRIQAAVEQLTPEERTVMQGITTSKTHLNLAHEMGISTTLLEWHRAKVMHKMAANSLAALVTMRLMLEERGEKLVS